MTFFFILNNIHLNDNKKMDLSESDKIFYSTSGAATESCLNVQEVKMSGLMNP